MLLDNLRHIFGADLGIPNAIRINHHRGANCAEPDGRAFGNDDAAFRILALRFFAKQNPALFQFPVESLFHDGTVSRRTRFSRADKNVMSNRRAGDWRELAQGLEIESLLNHADNRNTNAAECFPLEPANSYAIPREQRSFHAHGFIVRFRTYRRPLADAAKVERTRIAGA